ncbi:MAG: hypothetical protein L0Z73_03650 [Gammaproteobacteria bacterium]|nr:hypothetical protein [Gammaproteobacteria bacterium]
MPERNSTLLAALSTLLLPADAAQVPAYSGGSKDIWGNPDTRADYRSGAAPNAPLDGPLSVNPAAGIHYSVLPAFR